ncbi:MAG: hypothetical protein RJB62_1956 [Pseudomonadota bacterium]|jgi:hypothetical protein
MRLISSRLTYGYKILFPIGWYIALAAILAVALFTGTGAISLPPAFFVILVLMTGLSYLIFRGFVFPMADEVWDDGDALVIKRGRTEERIPLSDISHVYYFLLTNPERMTLSFHKPTAFGPRIPFALPLRWNVFTKSPIAEDLKKRINAAN